VHFEFDPHKSESNNAKHGIDFIEAQELWKSEIVLLSATYRGSTVRIISVRRATDREIEIYEKIAS
jgi:uncharacterized DUF497 family protein